MFEFGGKLQPQTNLIDFPFAASAVFKLETLNYEFVFVQEYANN
jgi:hypothetical protein